mmetsp:Transcript_29866/g.60083  ORF Transcript_29866/g.60083 Transcript_29866/m.60083 type:complete len:116 (+) Transcript_29866:324-671(+)
MRHVREREKMRRIATRQDLYDMTCVLSIHVKRVPSFHYYLDNDDFHVRKCRMKLAFQSQKLFKAISTQPPFVLHAVLVGHKRWLKQLVHKNVCDAIGTEGVEISLWICWRTKVEM